MATVSFYWPITEPGEPTGFVWSTVTTSFASVDLYVTSAMGEELAFSWVLADGKTVPGLLGAIQPGFGPHTIIDDAPGISIILYRFGGWDSPDGTVNLRVETVDGATPETWTQSYTLSSTLPTVRDGTHTATGLDRMLDQFDGSVNLRLLASSYLDQAQGFEDVAYQLINARSLAIVSGYQLDGLGQIVNVPRSGRTDEEYRLRIRAELAILLSQGTTEDLIGVLRLLLGLSSPPDIQIDEYYPKAIFMRPRNFIVDEDPTMIANLLRRAVSAATNLQFIYTATESDDDDLFRFSDTNGTSETSSSHGYSNGTYTGAK